MLSVSEAIQYRFLVFIHWLVIKQIHNEVDRSGFSFINGFIVFFESLKQYNIGNMSLYGQVSLGHVFVSVESFGGSWT